MTVILNFPLKNNLAHILSASEAAERIVDTEADKWLAGHDELAEASKLMWRSLLLCSITGQVPNLDSATAERFIRAIRGVDPSFKY